MSNVELSSSQRTILTTLVNEYQQAEAPVQGEVVAAALDRSVGTIRNRMQDLKAVGLVESVPGPGGGYEPTEAALGLLDRAETDRIATVALSQDFERVDVTVERVAFPSVHHPTACTAHVYCNESLAHVAVGDPIVVGPTPVTNLAVAGEVVAINDTADRVLLDVARIVAPLTEE
jgi:predicted transcriptional regulator